MGLADFANQADHKIKAAFLPKENSGLDFQVAVQYRHLITTPFGPEAISYH
jgi:hypothetical protein